VGLRWRGRRRRGRLCRGQGGGRLAELAGEQIADVEDARGPSDRGADAWCGGTISRGHAKFLFYLAVAFSRRGAFELEGDLGVFVFLVEGLGRAMKIQV